MDSTYSMLFCGTFIVIVLSCHSTFSEIISVYFVEENNTYITDIQLLFCLKTCSKTFENRFKIWCTKHWIEKCKERKLYFPGKF